METKQYIQVLENEVKVLSEYYQPQQEGTGHYNTAIGVLRQRIEELKNNSK